MDHFTPVPALVGGLLIGASAVAYLLFTGRYAGISGIARGAAFGGSDRSLDVLFVVGMLASGALCFFFQRGVAGAAPPLWAVTLGGMFVGYGTSLGRGCTSGHGVCGLGRLSLRSLAAVATFMAAGVATVFVVRHLAGLV